MRRIATCLFVPLCVIAGADDPIPLPVPDPISTPCEEEFDDWETAEQVYEAAQTSVALAERLLDLEKTALAECQAAGGNCTTELNNVTTAQNLVASLQLEATAALDALSAAEDALADCCAGVKPPEIGMANPFITMLLMLPFMG